MLLPMGLRLSEEKTKIVHIDQGFDFLGMHIQRHQQRGSTKRFVYTYPSRAALAAVKAKVRDATRRSTNQTLAILLHRLNPVLRGWTNYHRHGAVGQDLRLSLRLYLAAGVVLVVPQVPQDGDGRTATAPYPELVARAGRGVRCSTRPR